MGIIQVHPPEPRTPDSCDHPACSTPNPPFWCEGCNELPIDGWIPIMLLVGLVIGVFTSIKYGKTIQNT